MIMFYTESDFLRIQEWARCVQTYLRANTKYIFLVNNFVLLQLPNENAKEFLSWCESSLPFLMGCYSELLPSINGVLNEMNAVLEEISDAIRQLEEYQTTYQVLNEIDLETEERLQMEAENIDKLRSEGKLSLEQAEQVILELYLTSYCGLSSITGIPLVLSYPDETDPSRAEFLYYWKDADNKVTAVGRPFQLVPLLNCFHLNCFGVSPEGFYRYILYLLDMGLNLVDRTDTAALFLLEDNTKLMISFSDEELQIHSEGNQICFVLAPYILIAYSFQN